VSNDDEPSKTPLVLKGKITESVSMLSIMACVTAPAFADRGLASRSAASKTLSMFLARTNPTRRLTGPFTCSATSSNFTMILLGFIPVSFKKENRPQRGASPIQDDSTTDRKQANPAKLTAIQRHHTPEPLLRVLRSLHPEATLI